MRKIDKRTFDLWEGYDKGTTTLNDYSYRLPLSEAFYEKFLCERQIFFE